MGTVQLTKVYNEIMSFRVAIHSNTYIFRMQFIITVKRRTLNTFSFLDFM